MTNVHIALVGGQPEPVLYCIQDDKPDTVHLIYSKESLKILDAIKKELSGYDVRETLIDALDPNEIFSKVQEIKKEYSNDRIVLNISSGTKSWSYFFSKILGEEDNCTVIYFDQNNTLWNYTTLEGHHVELFELEKHFRLYGTPLEENYRKYSSYTEADYKAAKKIRCFRRYVNWGVFNNLTTTLSSDWSHEVEDQLSGKFTDPNGNFVEWDKTLQDGCQYARMVISSDNGTKELELSSPNTVNLLFNTGWFEYIVAHDIAKWQESRDILLNCKFKSTIQHDTDKNEVDIIFQTEKRIFFVECKTSLFKSVDIDKFRSVCKKYGGTSCIGILVVDNLIKETDKEKCRDNGIHYYSFKESKATNTTLQDKLQAIADNLNV